MVIDHNRLLLGESRNRGAMDRKIGMTAHKTGRQWRFKVSEVDEWLRSGNAAEKDDAEDESLD